MLTNEWFTAINTVATRRRVNTVSNDILESIAVIIYLYKKRYWCAS